MEQIVYRNLKKQDYNEVADLLSHAFGLHRYVSDKQLLQIFKKQYLYSCLSEATFSRVAEQNGKVVGVIMGNAKSDYRILPHIGYALKFLLYSFKLKIYGRKISDSISGYRELHRIYRKFTQRHKGEFDGVLTLFAVNSECRGKGIGKKLLFDVEAYWKEHQTKSIYLYTDTTCNYGFYEHQGFVRLEEENLVLKSDGKPFEMDVFLYGYAINQNNNAGNQYA